MIDRIHQEARRGFFRETYWKTIFFWKKNGNKPEPEKINPYAKDYEAIYMVMNKLNEVIDKVNDLEKDLRLND